MGERMAGARTGRSIGSVVASDHLDLFQVPASFVCLLTIYPHFIFFSLTYQSGRWSEVLSGYDRYAQMCMFLYFYNGCH